MAELGNINPIKKMGCPHCRAPLPDWSVDEILAAEHLYCPQCKKEVKLPEEVMHKLIQSRSLGRNLDITG